MEAFKKCPSCRGKGHHVRVQRKDQVHLWLQPSWKFPFVKLVVETFKDVFTVVGKKECTQCEGEGEIPIFDPDRPATASAPPPKDPPTYH